MTKDKALTGAAGAYYVGFRLSAEGYAGIMLWWAYKYGNYRKNGIVVVEDN